MVAADFSPSMQPSRVPRHHSRAQTSTAHQLTRNTTRHHKKIAAMMRMLMKQAVASRLLAITQRPVLPSRFLSAAACEEVTDDGPDYFDTLGMEVRLSCASCVCLVFRRVPPSHSLILLVILFSVRIPLT